MENQILDLEKRYWQGMAILDYDTVRDLTYFPCTVVSKDGVKYLDEPTYKKNFEMGKGMKMEIKGITEAVVQMFSKSFATIGYLIEIEVENQGQFRKAKCACSSAWIQENGKWKCSLHSEAEYSPTQH
ncbi:nuclear transport factor 2 family protein [Sphingobacterium sp.]|uniref:nuclear transport factor 2 family protein n=1 Tax=Sphingobacterium sp. TaxID=341027 RepID=UPI0028B129CD|nr:nuclear transport factor 2 family protein [Sphingobacterium sp.]